MEVSLFALLVAITLLVMNDLTAKTAPLINQQEEEGRTINLNINVKSATPVKKRDSFLKDDEIYSMGGHPSLVTAPNKVRLNQFNFYEPNRPRYPYVGADEVPAQQNQPMPQYQQSYQPYPQYQQPYPQYQQPYPQYQQPYQPYYVQPNYVPPPGYVVTPPTTTTTTTTQAPRGPPPPDPTAPIGYMLVDTYNTPRGQISRPVAFLKRS